MGLFDTIIADFKCPYCEYKITKEEMEKDIENIDAWQTKATACMMDVYRIGDKLNFEGSLKIDDSWIGIHHICPKCKKFVEAEIRIKKSKLRNEIRYKIEE